MANADIPSTLGVDKVMEVDMLDDDFESDLEEAESGKVLMPYHKPKMELQFWMLPLTAFEHLKMLMQGFMWACLLFYLLQLE
jgi:hypothetical protein